MAKVLHTCSGCVPIDASIVDTYIALTDMVNFKKGDPGKSAYQIAVENGFEGTEDEWLASLKGPVGDTPDISIGTVSTGSAGSQAAATMTGTPESPVLNLTIPQGFPGQTGPAGVTSATVSVNQSTGTPSAAISVENGVLSLSLMNVKGEQGNSGYSGAAGELEVVNNDVDGGAAAAWSAERGKIAAGKINAIAPLVATVTEYDIDGATKRNYQINSSNKYTTNDDYKHILVAVAPGDVISVTASGRQAQMAWLTDNAAPVSGGTPHFVSGTERFILEAGNVGQYTVPAGANYMYFYAGQSPYEYLPASAIATRSKIPSFSVLDQLDSTSKTDALSANKGNELKNDFNNLSEFIDAEIDLSSLTNVNYAYITSGGNYASNSGRYGKFIPVTAGRKYKLYGNADLASYYSFLTSKSVTAGSTPAYVTGTERMTIEAGEFVVATIPEGCNYLQFNTIYDETDRTPDAIVFLGGQVSELKTKDNQIQAEVSGLQERMANGIIGEMPLNATLTSGHGINCKTGEETTSTSLSDTDYISLANVSAIELSVNVGTIVNTNRGIAFYDSEKNFMRGVAYPYDTSLTTKTFTTKKYSVPEGAAYFRTCFFTDFESDFECTLMRSDAAENIAALLSGYFSVDRKDLLTIGSPEIYHHPEIAPGANATTVEQIYALYDDLTTLYPTWFARESDIGTASDGIHEIRHYRLRYNYNAVWTKGDYNNNRWEDFYSWRKLLLNAGTHGDEQSAVWGLYYFVKALLEGDWAKWAEYIRSNIQIDIVPVLNPYGLNHNTRSNANGVDINRQFSNTSCVESEALKALARDVLPFAFIDCHTVGTTHGNYLGYLGCTQGNPFFPTLARLVNNLAALCRADWSALASSVSIGNKPYIYCSIGEVTSNPTVAVGWIGANITQISTVCEALNVGSTSNKGKPMAKIIVDILANLIPTLMEVGSY